MIEVFRTNVTDQELANQLLEKLHIDFVEYKANFDLEDCDKILRVFSPREIQAEALIHFLKKNGVEASILPDEVPQINSLLK